MPQARYRRVLLKISGESLKGSSSSGIDPSAVNYLSQQIGLAQGLGGYLPAAQVSLLQQPFIKKSGSSVEEVVQELAAKVGENVRVLRFTRLALGE